MFFESWMEDELEEVQVLSWYTAENEANALAMLAR